MEDNERYRLVGAASIAAADAGTSGEDGQGAEDNMKIYPLRHAVWGEGESFSHEHPCSPAYDSPGR